MYLRSSQKAVVEPLVDAQALVVIFLRELNLVPEEKEVADEHVGVQFAFIPPERLPIALYCLVVPIPSLIYGAQLEIRAVVFGHHGLCFVEIEHSLFQLAEMKVTGSQVISKREKKRRVLKRPLKHFRCPREIARFHIGGSLVVLYRQRAFAGTIDDVMFEIYMVFRPGFIGAFLGQPEQILKSRYVLGGACGKTGGNRSGGNHQKKIYIAGARFHERTASIQVAGDT